MAYTQSPVGGFWVWAYVAFASVMFVLEQYLEVRQLRCNRITEVPSEFEGSVSKEKFVESQVYQKDKRLFGFYRDWFNFAWEKFGLFLITPACWMLAESICGVEAEYKTTLLWLFILQWVEKPISIPFSYYSNFVVEARHGFNKMTPMLFFTDLVKSELLSYVFGGALIPLVIWIVRRYGESAHLYLWGFCQALMMLMMWLYPNFIQPMFNKFETLKDESLRKQIEDLCSGVEFPLTKLFQVDGSKRSSHSNAYFFGFWKYKRIVLYDTLLHLKHEDILAILCHELGHWKFGHALVNMCIASAQLFMNFYLFGVVMYSGEFSRSLVRQFGFGESKAVIVSLILFFMLLAPVAQALQLMMTMLSRHFEFQADSFAATKGRGACLRSGLHQIHEENKGDLNPDPWYSWYHFSHPPLVERVRELKVLEAKLGKKAS